jgi:acyl transferase domain-containing protein
MRAQSPIEPIAVVGISLRLPGDANDLDGLWKLLESGAPAWTPVPADRYNEDVSSMVNEPFTKDYHLKLPAKLTPVRPSSIQMQMI